jgi:hypothetical protein
MKNVRTQAGRGMLVSWVNKSGEDITLPLIHVNGKWQTCGVFYKYGQSKSDPKFRVVFPLPYGWDPMESAQIKSAIRRARETN